MSTLTIPNKPESSGAQDPTDAIYDFLFCDDLDLYRRNALQKDIHPWDILLADADDPAGLQGIINDKDGETRLKILAYNRLKRMGYQTQTKELLGTIVEVGLDGGLDVLAAYQDGTARYINHSGKMIIWESPGPASQELINDFFRKSEEIVKRIGPWDQPRRPKPARGMARITFLVSDGLYFGEAPVNALFNDALAAPALHAATRLMQFLVETAGH